MFLRILTKVSERVSSLKGEICTSVEKGDKQALFDSLDLQYQHWGECGKKMLPIFYKPGLWACIWSKHCSLVWKILGSTMSSCFSISQHEKSFLQWGRKRFHHFSPQFYPTLLTPPFLIESYKIIKCMWSGNILSCARFYGSDFWVAKMSVQKLPHRGTRTQHRKGL